MIGWKKPFIIIRDEGAEPGWNIIDTSSQKVIRVNEKPGLRSQWKDIRLVPAEKAWQKLSAKKALW